MKETILADERMKLAVRCREPFTYEGTMYVPLKTMDDALEEALEFVPAEYKNDFRGFYDGNKNQNPRQEFIDYLYNIDDLYYFHGEDLKKAFFILNEAQHSLVNAVAQIKINTEKREKLFRKN